MEAASIAPSAGATPLQTSLEAKISSDRYQANLVKTVSGHDISVSFLQKGSFANPLFVAERFDLDLRVPNSKHFGIGDIRANVGSRRVLEVFDSSTRQTRSMTMKDWQRYFETADRSNAPCSVTRGLEFSSTKLETQVGSPRIVREVDWIDHAWPPHFKSLQFEPTNSLDDMMYPKVQKFCFMSQQSAFLDFQIDCGGASSW